MKILKETDRRSLIWYSAAAFILAVFRAGSVKFYESAYVSLPGRIEAVFLIVRARQNR